MAARYWVGGSGTWDTTSTTNWSTSSNGSAGASAPTSADTAIFDANSGNGYTVTLGEDVSVSVVTGNTALNLTFDFATYKISVSGASGFVYRVNGVVEYLGTPVIDLTYSGSSGTRSITPGAATVTNQPSFNITAGSDIISLTTGSAGKYKNLDFTGFSGTLTGLATATSIYGNLIISSGMTVGSGAGALTFAGTSGTQQITTNGKTLDFPVVFGSGTGTATYQLQDNLTTGSTRTVTLTNNALDLNNNTLSCGLFSSSNSNTRSIAFGTGNITVTGNGATVWTTSNMNGFSYTGTPTVNCTYAGSTGTRTILTGNTSNGATESNVLNFNISAGTDTVVLGTGVKNLNFTGFAGTASDNSRTVFGDLTISSGMTLGSGTGVLTFAATSGTKTITTNGKTIDCPIVYNGIGGTWSFADALTQGSTRAFTITNGTVKLKAGATSTVGAFATSGSNQKYLQSTIAGSQAILSQASGTVNASYLTIKDINVTGGATWNAYRNLNNIDAGNNIGWDFLSTPVTTTTLAMRLGFGL